MRHDLRNNISQWCRRQRKGHLLMFQHKLHVLVCHGNEICTY